MKAGRAEDGLRVGKPTENVVIRYPWLNKGMAELLAEARQPVVLRMYMSTIVSLTALKSVYALKHAVTVQVELMMLYTRKSA